MKISDYCDQHSLPLDARLELFVQVCDAIKAGLDEVRRVVREEEPVRPSTRLTTMRAAELANVSKHHGSEAPKLIREMRGDLDWIVMKALEKDRVRRYATANGLAMDIERYLSGEAILARPPSTTYKFRKLAARNKLLFSGVALTFVLLVISLITTTRWLVTERRTREQLRQQIEIVRLELSGLLVTLSSQRFPPLEWWRSNRSRLFSVPTKGRLPRAL